MSKTSSILVTPVKCINGCSFYPQITPNGKIKNYSRCRICRIYLDRNKVQKGIVKRTSYLIAGNFKQKKTQTVHPVCPICKVKLWDEKMLERHNQRMHQQK